jgi:cytochrome o ubiquinol oxidase subunit 3
MTAVTQESSVHGAESHSAHLHHHHEKENASKVIFGFWIYLMSDCVLFAVLFSVYGVLHNNTFGGVGIKEVASLPYIFVSTLALFTSGLSCGLALLSARQQKTSRALFWLLVTFVLGLVFLGMELHEFMYLVHTGNSWQRSAFLSSFFILVGVHGLHVLIGLIWLTLVFIQTCIKGTSFPMQTRLTCLGLFWSFLDIIWIFVITFVYLMGAI